MLLTRFRIVLPGSKSCQLRVFSSKTTGALFLRSLPGSICGQRVNLATQPAKHDNHGYSSEPDFHGGKRFIKLPLVTMDDMPIPQYPFKEMYDKEQWYFNRILAFGIAFFSFTVFCMWYDDTLQFEKGRMPLSYRNRHKEIAKYKKEEAERGGPPEPPKEKIYFNLDGPSPSSKKPDSLLSELSSTSAAASTALATTTQAQEPSTSTAKVVPANVKLPEHVKYLIVGAGSAGFSACRAIRGTDAEAKVLIIGEEENYPYMRPPLSKELWFSDDPKISETLRFKQWSGKERDLFFEKEEFYINPETINERVHGGVSIVRGRKVIKIDPVAHEAILDDQSKIKFDKCLIATGGKPKNLSVIENGGEDVMKRVTLYRRVEDFRKVDSIARNSESIVIIGGGFLGSELACALAHRRSKGSSGAKITQVFPESGNMHKVLPDYLSKYTTEKLRNDGITVLPEATIEKAEFSSGKVKLSVNNGETIAADHVIVAVGIEPNVELAKTSGLETDPEIGGFRCDEELRTRSDIYVAGDCCSFYDQKFGRRRVEHQEHAVSTGRRAGENMAGAAKPYKYQSMFWSDLGPDLGYEAIGIIDSSLPTVGIFAKASPDSEVQESSSSSSSTVTSTTAESQAVDSQASNNDAEKVAQQLNKDYRKGVVFYLKDKRIVGILFWNLYNRIYIARRILKEDVIYDDLNEVAKLFNIHDSPPVPSSQEAKDSPAAPENS